MGNYLDALENLNKSIELNNLFPQCYLARGIVKLKLADMDGLALIGRSHLH